MYTRKDLFEKGMTQYRIEKEVAEGRLLRLRRNCYVAAEASAKDKLNAVAQLYPDAVFSGTAALAAYGLCEVRLPAVVRVANNCRARADDLVYTVRSRPVPANRVKGVKMALPAQAVADALSFERCGEWLLKDALAQAYRGLNGRGRFAADVEMVITKKRDAVRELAERAPVGTASKWEQRMYHEMRRVGLKPVPNFRLGPYTWDLGFEAGTTVVDLDSLYYHAPEDNHREFLIGTWKTNHAVQHGWAPLKFTDECTDYHLKLVVETVQETVAHRRSVRGLKSRPPKVRRALATPAWRFHQSLL
ncbi:MAG: hypothetical protein E7K06_05355 [Corynebacterium sp.]|uniref:hypothetical protein n=1 Tax=Corynebacterium sp. TaxID=1720 RepID=UPI00280BD665|nr:hypothetical protein [Corynebacterium sp.]MDU3166058.1 hypothetical protein [Corynebacterium sp.]MDU4634331.1 hypothetical protein [Corynebacterium sp.]MDU5328245.1 hypothetical protein [Corynebacterium sp.]MDU6417207.1 hypothetical protein [Corynebacterium sp.]MDU6591915.1 hypothetical protein [Corynebacterium sp.]